MDGLDPDMICVVPDTPEHLLSKQSRYRSSIPSLERMDTRKDVQQLSPHQDVRRSIRNRHHPHRDSNERDGLPVPNTQEDLFRQADLARSMSKSAESKPELTTVVSNGVGQKTQKSIYQLAQPANLSKKVANPEHDKEKFVGSSRNGRLTLRKPCTGNGINLSRKPVTVEENTIILDEDNHEALIRDKGKGIDQYRDAQHRKWCSSSGLSDINQPKVACQSSTKSVDLEKNSSAAVINSQDNRKIIDLDSKSKSNVTRDNSLRSTGQRRLVRNGCISPMNIQRDKSIPKSNCDQVKMGSISSHEVQVISPDSNDRCNAKLKAKAKMDDVVLSSSQHVTDNSSSSRVISTLGKEAVDDEGWRKTHTEIRKPSVCPLSNSTRNQSDGSAKGNRSLPTTVHVNVPEVTSTLHQSNVIPAYEPQTRNNNGKRKFSSTSHTGDCSSSSSIGSSMTNLQTSRQALNLRPVGGLGPHNGDSPSQDHAITSDNNVEMDRQVESDEILARQLQEELYNETPRAGGLEEIDATIAWSLLQEDHRYVSTWRRPPRHRDTSSSSSRTISHQSQTRAANRARRPMSNRMAQLRRELNQQPMRNNASLNMRLDFLEALEVAFANGNNAQRQNLISQMQRDFNENDYEMLLALDDNISHAGASETRINNLPESVVQNENPEETCAVCLDSPSVGDTIRHLPCLHKFHKDCIDTWLRRKTTCPICKSSIT